MGCVQSDSVVTPSKNEAQVAKYTNKYDGNGELLDLNVKRNQAFTQLLAHCRMVFLLSSTNFGNGKGTVF
jgi:hypothetical protein